MTYKLYQLSKMLHILLASYLMLYRGVGKVGNIWGYG